MSASSSLDNNNNFQGLYQAKSEESVVGESVVGRSVISLVPTDSGC